MIRIWIKILVQSVNYTPYANCDFGSEIQTEPLINYNDSGPRPPFQPHSPFDNHVEAWDGLTSRAMASRF